MKKVFIVVEGYTELQFIKEVLSYYLKQKLPEDHIEIIPFPISTNANLGKKGGGNSYKHWKNDLLKHTQKLENKIVTTFMDYYRLPENFPNYKNCLREKEIDERLSCLEQAIKEDIAPNNYKFFPYIQKYEFETLLFSSNKGFESLFEEIASKTRKIITKYPNPEDINNQPDTAPSKRLLKIKTDYDKVADGTLIALEIGIDKMLEKCPRFRNWVEKIIVQMES
jgi:Domain of unknown function (DUF4276)